MKKDESQMKAVIRLSDSADPPFEAWKPWERDGRAVMPPVATFCNGQEGEEHLREAEYNIGIIWRRA